MLESECKRKLAPDFKTIADFRKYNSEQLKKVFKEFVAIDGSSKRVSIKLN